MTPFQATHLAKSFILDFRNREPEHFPPVTQLAVAVKVISGKAIEPEDNRHWYKRQYHVLCNLLDSKKEVAS